MSDTIRMTNLGPLHDLLLKACPPSESNMRSIPILALAIEYTPQGLYKVIRKGKVTPQLAAKIVDASKGEVSLDDFHPYVYV